MPTIFFLHGFRFFFVALDRGEPVHIHVEKGDSYAKYWLDPMKLARSKGFKPHELTQIGRKRKSWRLIGGGVGVHWSALDEDILVESLLRG